MISGFFPPSTWSWYNAVFLWQTSFQEMCLIYYNWAHPSFKLQPIWEIRFFFSACTPLNVMRLYRQVSRTYSVTHSWNRRNLPVMFQGLMPPNSREVCLFAGNLRSPNETALMSLRRNTALFILWRRAESQHQLEPGLHTTRWHPAKEVNDTALVTDLRHRTVNLWRSIKTRHNTLDL